MSDYSSDELEDGSYYDDDDDYDYVDWDQYDNCEPTIRKTVKKWFRNIKNRIWYLLHKEDVSDIPF